jgi:hypothetical protein
LSPLNITKGFRTIGIWPYNLVAIEGKMGPSLQFVPGVPDYNANKTCSTFYAFSDNDNDGERNAPGRGVSMLHSDSDTETDEGNDTTIPEDDLGLQILLGEHIISSQPDQQHFFVTDGDEDVGGSNSSGTFREGLQQGGNAERHHNH